MSFGAYLILKEDLIYPDSAGITSWPWREC